MFVVSFHYFILDRINPAMRGAPAAGSTLGSDRQIIFFTTEIAEGAEFFYRTQIYTDEHRLFFHHEEHEAKSS